MSNAPVRRLLVFDLEITRPRLVCEKVLRRTSPRSPDYCPAPSVLANQALKPVPQPQRAQIVDCQKDHQRQDERKPAAERNLQRLGAERATPNGLDDVEKQVASIQHRNWQEVDESEIN